MSKSQDFVVPCDCCGQEVCLLKERKHFERAAQLLRDLLNDGHVKPTRRERAWLNADKKRFQL